VLVSLIIVQTVHAHAVLVRSIPAANTELLQAPGSIELWFSEPLEAEFSSVRLITSTGAEILPASHNVDPADPTHLTATLAAPLPPGFYTVAWRSLSRADGHEWLGSYPFTVLNPDGSRPSGAPASATADIPVGLPSPLEVAARWLSLLGGMLLLGIALFLTFVAGESMQANPELETRLNTVGSLLVMTSVLAIVVGTWLQLFGQASQLGDLSVLPRLTYGTYGGALAIARQLFACSGLLIVLSLSPRALLPYEQRALAITAIYAALMAILLVVAIVQGAGWPASVGLAIFGVLLYLAGAARQNAATDHIRRWKYLLVSGCATLLYFSLGSHAGGVPGSFWAILFDAVHYVASSAWLGGLVILPIVLAQYRLLSAGTGMSALRPLFRQYGYMAKFSFFLLLTTGTLNSLVHLPSWNSLIDTAYGRVLLLKIALMLAVWWISMRSSRLFRGKPDPSRMDQLLIQFSRQITTAAWIGLFLMIAVAVLVQTQPPERIHSQHSHGGYVNLVNTADLSIHVEVTPAQVGINHFYTHLAHEDGSPIGEVQLVRLIFENQDLDLGQSTTELSPMGVDFFGVEGAFLNQPGHWKLSLYVRRRGVDDVLADLGTLQVSAVQQESSLFANPITNIPVALIWAGVLIVIGAEIFRWRKTLQQLQPTLERYYLYLGGLLILLGFGLGLYWLLS
jgi:copper transport protein